MYYNFKDLYKWDSAIIAELGMNKNDAIGRKTTIMRRYIQKVFLFTLS